MCPACPSKRRASARSLLLMRMWSPSKVETTKTPSPPSDKGLTTDRMMPVAPKANGPTKRRQVHPASVVMPAGTRDARQTMDNSNGERLMVTKPGPSAHGGIGASAGKRLTAYSPVACSSVICRISFVAVMVISLVDKERCCGAAGHEQATPSPPLKNAMLNVGRAAFCAYASIGARGGLV
eukprot:gene27218-33908_t